MSLKDLLELAEKYEERINAYWNFYTIVALAVTGWIFTKSSNFDAFPSFVAVIALGVFFLANFTVIGFATKKLIALESEIEAVASTMELKSEKYIRKLSAWSIPNRLTYSLALHLAIDFVVVGAVIMM